MSVVLQTGVMYYRESQADSWHPLILKVDADISSLIEEYSQKTWLVGEYCHYLNAVYRCTTPITTPEAWDSTHWQETTIGEELKNITDITGDGDLDSGFTATELTGAANELKTDVGDLEDITGDGSLTGFTATDLTGAANELKNSLNSLDDDKAEKTDLALIRTGATNTGSQINAGTYFYLDGILKKATQNIANGASFTNSNCETVTAGGLNDALKVESVSLSGTYANDVSCKRVGNVVHLNVSAVENVPSGAWLNIATCSVKPIDPATALIPNASVSAYALLRCTKQGEIQIYHNTGSAQNFFNGNLTFFI